MAKPTVDRLDRPCTYRLILEGYSRSERLYDPQWVERFLSRWATLADMDVLQTWVQHIGPEVHSGPGVSGLQLISTSHIALHTWQLSEFFMLEISSCKAFDPLELLEFAKTELEVDRWDQVVALPFGFLDIDTLWSEE